MERDENPVLAVVADRTLASLEASLQVLELVGVSGLNASQRSRLRSIEERAAELNRDPLGLSDALSAPGSSALRSVLKKTAAASTERTLTLDAEWLTRDDDGPPSSFSRR